MFDNNWDVLVADKDNDKKTIGALILANGFRPNKELYEIMKSKLLEVYAIGDYVETRSGECRLGRIPGGSFSIN